MAVKIVLEQFICENKDTKRFSLVKIMYRCVVFVSVGCEAVKFQSSGDSEVFQTGVMIILVFVLAKAVYNCFLFYLKVNIHLK